MYLDWLRIGLFAFFPDSAASHMPVSIMSGTDYLPLVIRLDDFYLNSGLLPISFIGTPLIVGVAVFLMQQERFSLARAVTCLVVPFLLALIIQYFISVQLDKYLRFPREGHAVPWRYLFQPAIIVRCCWVAMAYVAYCLLLHRGLAAVQKFK